MKYVKLSKLQKEAEARLEDIQSDEVSLVPKAANRFPFILIKNQSAKKKEESEKQTEGFEIISTQEKDDEFLATGIVLKAGVPDGQGDVATHKAVKYAAHNFLIARQKGDESKKLGVDHAGENTDLEIVESFVAWEDITMDDREIKKGSWVITVKVLDADVWSSIKKGSVVGFSIEGTAYGRNL